jgi:hypothetical protein
MSGLISGAVCAGIGAVTGIVSAINGADAQERALAMQFSQTALNLRTQKDLEEAKMKLNNDTEFLRIYADTSANIIKAHDNAKIQADALLKATDKKNLVITSVGGGIIVIGALAVLKFA